LNLDPGYLFVSMCVSGVGYVLFKYGRSQRRVPHVGMGIVLMVYPYFVSDLWLMFGIGAALCALLYLAVRMGA